MKINLLANNLVDDKLSQVMARLLLDFECFKELTLCPSGTCSDKSFMKLSFWFACFNDTFRNSILPHCGHCSGNDSSGKWTWDKLRNISTESSFVCSRNPQNYSILIQINLFFSELTYVYSINFLIVILDAITYALASTEIHFHISK